MLVNTSTPLHNADNQGYLLFSYIVKYYITELNYLKNGFTNKVDFNLHKKFKEFKFLINKKNLKRMNCILLPIEAVLKALK